MSMNQGLLTICQEPMGYALKGKRCWGSHAWGVKGRTNVIGALVGGLLLTVTLFQENMNSEIFTAWLRQDLLPKLPYKSVVVMDNAAFHKGQKIQQILEADGHTLLYLPTYSPDLNPIERKWARGQSTQKKIPVSQHSRALPIDKTIIKL
ncbi:MAG: transposase [Alphaproteobacteria bacterium]